MSWTQNFKMMVSLTLAYVLCCVSSGQVVTPDFDRGAPRIPDRLLYDFKNEADDVVAKGQFVERTGGTVLIRLPDHTVTKIKLANLNQETIDWIRKQVALQKKSAKRAEQAREIVRTIDRSVPRSIVKGCSKLRPLGRDAAVVSQNITAMFNHPDEKAKLACFCIYPRICELNLESLSLVTAFLNKNKNGMRRLVADKPEAFLKSMATMDYVGLPYLQHVAYHCKLRTDPGWMSRLEIPVELQFSKGAKNELRRAAIVAIGQMESEDATNVLLNLVRVVEEPINGKQDESAISALISALGSVGNSNGEVLAFIQRHRENFPKEASKALENLSKD